MDQNGKEISCPQIRVFDYHRFFSKNGSYGYGANSRWGPQGSILGPMGSHWNKKWVKTVKNYHATKFEFSTTPRSSIFLKKKDVTVMGPNHSSDSLGSILGRMGSHWVKKMGQNRQKLPSHKIRIFDNPAVINFSQKMEVMFMAQNHGWDSLGSIFGPMGSHWVEKFDQNGKKLPCPKIRIFDYPAVIDFSQKIEVTVKASNHGGDSLGSILGPMGSHWDQKMGQNRKKLPCRKIPAVIDFSQKIEVTVKASNHGGDSLGSILGPMASHWVKKMGQNCENLPCPKNEFSTTLLSSIFLKKN